MTRQLYRFRKVAFRSSGDRAPTPVRVARCVVICKYDANASLVKRDG